MSTYAPSSTPSHPTATSAAIDAWATVADDDSDDEAAAEEELEYLAQEHQQLEAHLTGRLNEVRWLLGDCDGVVG